MNWEFTQERNQPTEYIWKNVSHRDQLRFKSLISDISGYYGPLPTAEVEKHFDALSPSAKYGLSVLGLDDTEVHWDIRDELEKIIKK